MIETLHITLNIHPYRLEDAQRRQIADACGGRGVEIRTLPADTDLERVEGRDTHVLVTEDIPRGLSRWPDLRFVQLISAGIDHLDGHPIWNTGVQVATAAGTHAVPIAQYVVCTVLMLAHHMSRATAFKDTRQWPDRVSMASATVRGRTVGLIGYGGIGRECARQLHALGMRILCLKNDPRQRQQTGFIAFEGTGDPEGSLPERWFGPDELEEMLPQCDVLVVTAPRTRATTAMIGRVELSRLPRGARIVVVSRGGIVEETALAEALLTGHIAGAAVDAYMQEPPPADHPLFNAPNLIMTPHMSGVFEDYWHVAKDILCLNISRVAQGERPLNQTSGGRGY